MSPPRVELLSRLGFVRAFPLAILDYSRTPWVQGAALYGSMVTSVGTFPILVAKKAKSVRVFYHDGRWKRLSQSRRKELDPAGLLRTLKKKIFNEA